MKHIKTYEQNSDEVSKYWLIPTDDRASKALDKIGITDKKRMMNSIKQNRIFRDYIFVGYFGHPNGGYFGHRIPMDGNFLHSKEYDKDGYINMGAVDIPDYEIDVKKYNL